MKPEDILKYAERLDSWRSTYYPAELIHTFQANDEAANSTFREYAGALSYFKRTDGEQQHGPYLLEAIECAAEMEDLYWLKVSECWPWAEFDVVHFAACLLYMAEVGETD